MATREVVSIETGQRAGELWADPSADQCVHPQERGYSRYASFPTRSSLVAPHAISSWSEFHHTGENLSALRWLRDRDLLGDDDVSAVLATRPGWQPGTDVGWYLEKNADGSFNHHRIGCLLLRWLEDLDRPVRARASAVAEIARDMLRPGSDIASVARGIEDHYRHGEHPNEAAADSAVLVQLRSAVNQLDADRRERVDATHLPHGDAGRRVLGDYVRYGRSRWWSVGWIVVAILIAAVPQFGAVPDGSGWAPFLRFASVPIAFLGAWAFVRSAGVILTPTGVEFRRLFRSRHEPWNRVVDVDIDNDEVHHEGSWLFGPREVELVAITIADPADTSRFERVRFGTAGRSALAIHREIVEFARSQGSELSEWPDTNVQRFGAALLAGVGAGVLVLAMSWGLGLCRYGDCGEGWLIARLATKTDTAWVEEVTAIEYEDLGDSVVVECPDRVSTDPSDSFQCEVDGIDGIDGVEVRFTNRAHDEISWVPT